jgi:hypothetical protein
MAPARAASGPPDPLPGSPAWTLIPPAPEWPWAAGRSVEDSPGIPAPVVTIWPPAFTVATKVYSPGLVMWTREMV